MCAPHAISPVEFIKKNQADVELNKIKLNVMILHELLFKRDAGIKNDYVNLKKRKKPIIYADL
jgi:hypothetical protein